MPKHRKQDETLIQKRVAELIRARILRALGICDERRTGDAAEKSEDHEGEIWRRTIFPLSKTTCTSAHEHEQTCDETDIADLMRIGRMEPGRKQIERKDRAELS